MGNDAAPRPGYDTCISFRGQGTIVYGKVRTRLYKELRTLVAAAAGL